MYISSLIFQPEAFLLVKCKTREEKIKVFAVILSKSILSQACRSREVKIKTCTKLVLSRGGLKQVKLRRGSI